MTEIQKFDPALLMEGVKDRIKATFVSLIPDNKWEEMCQQVCDNFFTRVKVEWRQDYISKFDHLATDILKELASLKIKEFMKTYTDGNWNANSAGVSDILKEFILNNADKILFSVVGGMIQQTVNNINNNRGY